MFFTAAHEFTIKTFSTSLSMSLKKIADRLGSNEDEEEGDDDNDEEEEDEEDEEEEDVEQGKNRKRSHSPVPEQSAKK